MASYQLEKRKVARAHRELGHGADRHRAGGLGDLEGHLAERARSLQLEAVRRQKPKANVADAA